MKRITTLKWACRVRTAARALLILVIIWNVPPASAQVPPHQPGTICFTPQFWCWMTYPGIPGQPCWCPSPWGPVRGSSG